MNYPDMIKAKSEELASQTQKWVDAKVLPHLVELLNTAQQRIKRPIRFASGNGTYIFCVDHTYRNWTWWLTEAASQQYDEKENPVIDRLRQRFPELVEFVDIVVAIGDELGQEFIGDVYPTTEARQA